MNLSSGTSTSFSPLVSSLLDEAMASTLVHRNCEAVNRYQFLVNYCCTNGVIDHIFFTTDIVVIGECIVGMC